MTDGLLLHYFWRGRSGLVLGGQRFGVMQDLSGSLQQGIAAADGFYGTVDHGIAESSQFFLIQSEPAFRAKYFG